MGAVGRMVGVVFLVLVLTVTGCGDDGDNDNGIAFRGADILQGELNVSEEQTTCQVPTITEGFSDPSIEIALDDLLANGYPSSIFRTGFCRAYLVFENNLLNQAIVVERIDYEYEIPGARIPVPGHSQLVGLRINPANANPETNPNPYGKVNVVIFQPSGQLIPASLALFLVQNGNSLPALPYTIIVHIRGRARTDGGKVLESNELRYTVQVLSSGGQ